MPNTMYVAIETDAGEQDVRIFSTEDACVEWFRERHPSTPAFDPDGDGLGTDVWGDAPDNGCAWVFYPNQDGLELRIVAAEVGR